jgi:peroxisomal enoyl-CoA hydratase 2
LSGDYNPLHIDPTIGERLGFGGIILHGLSTFGFAARAIIKSVGANDPKSLKFFGVRFTSPVKPGDKLETQAWEVGSGPEGTTEVAFITKNLTSGKVSTENFILTQGLTFSQVCIGGGIAYVRKPSQAKM